MFENPRRGRETRNFATNVPKILDLKSSSEQIFSEKLTLGVPGTGIQNSLKLINVGNKSHDIKKVNKGFLAHANSDKCSP